MNTRNFSRRDVLTRVCLHPASDGDAVLPDRGGATSRRSFSFGLVRRRRRSQLHCYPMSYTFRLTGTRRGPEREAISPFTAKPVLLPTFVMGDEERSARWRSSSIRSGLSGRTGSGCTGSGLTGSGRIPEQVRGQRFGSSSQPRREAPSERYSPSTVEHHENPSWF